MGSRRELTRNVMFFESPHPSQTNPTFVVPILPILAVLENRSYYLLVMFGSPTFWQSGSMPVHFLDNRSNQQPASHEFEFLFEPRDCYRPGSDETCS